ncbi:MAG: hypothetical protein U0610_08725 [bacterium]
MARAEHGALLEVLARPKRAAQDWLRARPRVGDLETFGERLHVQIHGGATEALAEQFRVALAAEGLEVLALRAVAPSLEDIFIARAQRRVERAAGGSAPRNEHEPTRLDRESLGRVVRGDGARRRSASPPAGLASGNSSAAPALELTLAEGR